MYSYTLAKVACTIAAVTLAGCASIDVSSYVARGAHVRQYRTFAWVPSGGLETGDARLDNNVFFDERVRARVEKGLSAYGFEKVGDRADVLIQYHASVSQEIDWREADRQYGTCEDNDCRPFVSDVGTLVIDLVDPQTRKVVWRGWAKDAFAGVIDSQALMEARIDEAVARILKRLPSAL